MTKALEPTGEAQHTFAVELRRARDDLGLSQETFAQRVGVSRQLISGVERRTTPPTLRFARKVDKALGVRPKFEGLLVTPDELQTLVRRYVAIEQEQAVALRQWQIAVIPALLQTEAYARATVEAAIPAHTPARNKAAVKDRLTRQGALTRPEPLNAHFILAEGALIQMVGSPRVMVEQWRHILMCASLPNVTVQVLARQAGAHASMQGSYTLLESAPTTWAVYVETSAGAEVHTHRQMVQQTRARFDQLMAAGMSPAASNDLVQHLITETERTSNA